jgi:protein phosphatase
LRPDEKPAVNSEADRTDLGTTGIYSWGAVSITGNFRENNEDRFLVDPCGHFFLVADGMGGQSAGEKASELAIELISDRLEALIDFQKSSPPIVIDGIDKAVSHANVEIMALGELDPNYKNMGTTITFIVVVNGELYVGGIGDSRAYLLRDEHLEQLTEDHSLTQALVKAGTITPEEAQTHRYKNVLYRYLGTKEGGTGTEPRRFSPRPGDRLMLCSDGISDGTTREVIQSILESETDPKEAARRLVEAAQKGGSKDNITCIVVHVNR